MQKYSALLGYSNAYVKMLRRFNAWQVIFVPHWFESADAADCQVTDLRLRRDLEAFKEIDREVAEAVLKTFSRHFDFLAPEYSFLSIVSNKVTVEEQLLLLRQNLSH